MTPPTKPDYVLREDCKAKHNNTKRRQAGLFAIVLALLAVPCAATGIAWSALSKAESVETTLDAQAEFLNTTLSDIKKDVREIRQEQLRRNGGGE